ncbi:TIGR02444 family protein [Zavarzinia sp. CC-PAN008]|uniref:TIGR02444 family protein n=1 Tax=Zavarzinia sp. CC-PAN008 TaxID=3243332 RepID=UPI003F744E12
MDVATRAAAFWAEAAALYARPGMAELCLELQDHLGLDVNTVLLCCFSASRGRGLEPWDLSRAVITLAPWRAQVVEPLRTLRRGLKGMTGAEPTRQAIAAAELEAERRAQAILVEALGPWPPDGPPVSPLPALAALGVPPRAAERLAQAAQDGR